MDSNYREYNSIKPSPRNSSLVLPQKFPKMKTLSVLTEKILKPAMFCKLLNSFLGKLEEFQQT